MKRFIAYALLALPCAIACGPTPPPGGGSGGTGATGGSFPCNVVHATSLCQGCHNGIFTVPALQTLADFQAASALAASAVSSGVMPQGGGVSAQGRSDLAAWWSAGAPAGTCP